MVPWPPLFPSDTRTIPFLCSICLLPTSHTSQDLTRNPPSLKLAQNKNYTEYHNNSLKLYCLIDRWVYIYSYWINSLPLPFSWHRQMQFAHMYTYVYSYFVWPSALDINKIHSNGVYQQCMCVWITCLYVSNSDFWCLTSFQHHLLIIYFHPYYTWFKNGILLLLI